MEINKEKVVAYPTSIAGKIIILRKTKAIYNSDEQPPFNNKILCSPHYK